MGKKKKGKTNPNSLKHALQCRRIYKTNIYSGKKLKKKKEGGGGNPNIKGMSGKMTTYWFPKMSAAAAGLLIATLLPPDRRDENRS